MLTTEYYALIQRRLIDLIMITGHVQITYLGRFSTPVLTGGWFLAFVAVIRVGG